MTDAINTACNGISNQIITLSNTIPTNLSSIQTEIDTAYENINAQITTLGTSVIQPSLESIAEQLKETNNKLDTINTSICTYLSNIADALQLNKDKFIKETAKELFANFDFANNSNISTLTVAVKSFDRASTLADLLNFK